RLARVVGAGPALFLVACGGGPCGLNAMYGHRDGPPPLARATGGLAGTIGDGATGCLFGPAEKGALLETVRRALAVRREPRRWREIQRPGMLRDFSWSAAARQYAALYSRLAMPATA